MKRTMSFRTAVVPTIMAMAFFVGSCVAQYPLPCTYVGKGKWAQLEPHAHCAALLGSTPKISPEHLANMAHSVRADISDSVKGLASAIIAGQWYYIKPDGQTLPVVTYDNGADYFSEGLVRSLQNGKIAYFDSNFKQVLPPKYDWAWPFENGSALVCLGCKAEREGEHSGMIGGVWGYIDKQGHEVVPVRLSFSEANSIGIVVRLTWGIAIKYPEDSFYVTKNPRKSYLQNGTWNTYAGLDSKGQRIVALVLYGSNDVTDAELRIGASRDPTAVAACTKPSDALRPGSLGHAKLDGVDFVTWEAGDAAMSHYLLARSYRAEHVGACYAIDLIVFGTNPEVYDPPRTPPFTRTQAFARLQQVLGGFRFIRQ